MASKGNQQHAKASVEQLKCLGIPADPSKTAFKSYHPHSYQRIAKAFVEQLKCLGTSAMQENCVQQL